MEWRSERDLEEDFLSLYILLLLLTMCELDVMSSRLNSG